MVTQSDRDFLMLRALESISDVVQSVDLVQMDKPQLGNKILKIGAIILQTMKDLEG